MKYLLSATFLVTATAALAQTASPAPSAADEQPITLNELVVSGKDVSSFRSESVQLGTFRDMNPVDVPMTVNAVTQDVVQAQQDTGLMGALRNTAGVTLYELGGATYSNIAVRGISLQNRTNFRLNGALPLVNLIEYPLEATDRVEVLKGAAALYYGYVTPSGVVDYVTKRPTQQPYESATFTVNSYGAYGGSIDVSRRVDTGNNGYVGLRVNAGATQMDPGVNNYDGYRDFVTLAADWRISDRVLMRFDYLHVKEAVSEISYLSIPIVAGVAQVPAPPATTFNMGSSWMKSNQFANAGLLRTDIILSSNWTVLSEIGVANLQRARNNDSFAITNVATGAGTLSVPYAKGQRYLNRNGRVELYGRFETGPVKHNLSIGVTGNQQQQDSPTAPSIKYADNFYNPIPIAQSDANTFPVPHQYNPIRDYGPYFVERMSVLNDQLQLVGGARYEEYYNASGPVAPFPATAVFRSAGWSPGASLVYKPVANASVYASYMQGLEESGIAPATAANAYQVLPPLQSKQYEVGAKAQVLGGTLLQLGAFELHHPGTFLNAANTLVPNGITKSQGLEFSASGEIVPSVSLIGSAMLMTDRQTAPNPATFGLQTEDTPKQTFSLFADWHTPVAGLDFSAGTYYTGRKAVNNSDQGWVGGYTLYSAGAGYGFKIGKIHYELRAACDNLLDKRAWAGAGANLLSAQLPRIARFSVKASY